MLIIQPESVLAFMGFAPIHERFFPCQGGVFHIILAMAYSFGAIDVIKNRTLLLFAIIVKLTAAIFLFSYYLIIDAKWIILVSGITDFLMGLAIFIILEYFSNSFKKLERIE